MIISSSECLVKSLAWNTIMNKNKRERNVNPSHSAFCFGGYELHPRGVNTVFPSADADKSYYHESQFASKLLYLYLIIVNDFASFCTAVTSGHRVNFVTTNTRCSVVNRTIVASTDSI